MSTSRAGSTMEGEDGNGRLSRISTMWTVLRQAHEFGSEDAGAARARILEHYSPAIRRYFLGALRDADGADELYQEFALRFVRGDFRRADESKGRFRDFLRTTLYHLIVDHQRRTRKRSLTLPEEIPDPQSVERRRAADGEFAAACRAAFLDRAWSRLADLERQVGQPFHTVLRYRTDHPAERSPVMAKNLGERFGRELTPEWVRKKLLQARAHLASFLIEEVAAELDAFTLESLEAELMDLGLYEYCKEALNGMRAQA